jgi:archaellum biogenesis protein FlaJ (TadC family)
MYSTIYWITRLDAIQALFIAAAILGVVGIVYSLVFLSNINYESDENIASAKKIRRWSTLLTPIAVILLVFIPSKEDAILIYAGGKAYDYVKSDTSLQKMPHLTTEYLKVLLEKEIKEAKEQE